MVDNASLFPSNPISKSKELELISGVSIMVLIGTDFKRCKIVSTLFNHKKYLWKGLKVGHLIS